MFKVCSVLLYNARLDVEKSFVSGIDLDEKSTYLKSVEETFLSKTEYSTENLKMLTLRIVSS
jgi:hypothetical protein